MLGNIYHVGLTVKNMDRSIAFYRDVLGLQMQGELLMEGPETDALFQAENCRVRVAYLKGSNDVDMPPVELIEFLDKAATPHRNELRQPSISELCFLVQDIEALYQHLIKHHVECLSAPQYFDLTSQGFGKSKAIYFRDPDGIIIEAIQNLSE